MHALPGTGTRPVQPVHRHRARQLWRLHVSDGGRGGGWHSGTA
jgi:hypothetical protein